MGDIAKDPMHPHARLVYGEDGVIECLECISLVMHRMAGAPRPLILCHGFDDYGAAWE